MLVTSNSQQLLCSTTSATGSVAICWIGTGTLAQRLACKATAGSRFVAVPTRPLRVLGGSWIGCGRAPQCGLAKHLQACSSLVPPGCRVSEPWHLSLAGVRGQQVVAEMAEALWLCGGWYAVENEGINVTTSAYTVHFDG